MRRCSYPGQGLLSLLSVFLSMATVSLTVTRWQPHAMEWPLSEPAKGSRDMLGAEGTCMGLQRQQEVFKKKVAGGWDTGVSVLQRLNPLQVPNKEKKGQRAAGGRVRVGAGPHVS